jgi:hypothetical protein
MQAKYLPKIFSATGFIIGEAVYAYLELVPYVSHSTVLLFFENLSCPPALLSMLLFDVNAHSVEGFEVWSVIAVLNAGLYGSGWRSHPKNPITSESPWRILKILSSLGAVVCETGLFY